MTPKMEQHLRAKGEAGLRRERREAEKALALALPYRTKDLRARIVCEANETMIRNIDVILGGAR
jgi:lauroyl/myristoyl acyltransferase